MKKDMVDMSQIVEVRCFASYSCMRPISVPVMTTTITYKMILINWPTWKWMLFLMVFLGFELWIT